MAGVRHLPPRAPRPPLLTWTRLIGGVLLVVGGLVVIVVAGDRSFGGLNSTILAVVATLIGVVLLTVPLWMRMWRALNEERAARIRNAEREEIASHLHDSVLQTLALIQKKAHRPEEVARLARSQERELRAWLFSDPPRRNAVRSRRRCAASARRSRTPMASTWRSSPSVICGPTTRGMRNDGRRWPGATRERWSTRPSIPVSARSTCTAR